MKSAYWIGLAPLALALCLFGSSRVAAQGVTGHGNETAKEQMSARVPLISGHVYRADNGAPLARIVVTLYAGAMAISNLRYPHVETETDGSYRFYDLAPQYYSAAAAGEGFVRQEYDRDRTITGKFLAVNLENPLKDIDFHLALAGMISGSVVDEHDKAVGEIEVSAVRLVFSAGGLKREHRIQVTQTDERGSFRLAGLEPGSYYVCVNGPNGNLVAKRTGGESYRETYYGNATTLAGAQTVRVKAGDETRNIRISVPAEKRYTITANVSGRDQDGVPSRYDYQVSLTGRNHSSSTKFDGSFTIPDIPPGDYTLVAEAWQGSAYVAQSTAMVHVIDSDVEVSVKVNVQAGGRGEVSGKAFLINSKTPNFGSLRLIMRSQEGAGTSAGIDPSGQFVMRPLPGEYTFKVLGTAQPAQVYVKQARCLGRDYTSQPLGIESAQVLTNCEIALADDVGVVQGRVTSFAWDMVAVLIPDSIELRKLGHDPLLAKIRPDGSFASPYVSPGHYLLLAVHDSEDHFYFAIDFADRNRRSARRVSVKPRQTQVVELNPLPDIR